jgi:hypothetical protein
MSVSLPEKIIIRSKHTMETTKIAVFRGMEIRKTIHRNEWWFAVNDVVQALTDTPNVKDYVRKMRIRDEQLGKGWGQIVTPLSIVTSGGPQQINCANTEGIFRIIQSIPSPKAEPFKRWLARVGYERIQEIEDPELSTKNFLFSHRVHRGHRELNFFDTDSHRLTLQSKNWIPAFAGMTA